MKLEYQNIIHLLMDSFPVMQVIYDNNTNEYIDLPYAFFEDEFVPYIMNNLYSNNINELKKIFSFIEKLFIDGDEMVVNLVGVAVVESIFFEKKYGEFKDVIYDLSGDKTRESFSECVF